MKKPTKIPAHEQWLYKPENKHILKMLTDAIESLKKNPKQGKSWEQIKKDLKLF